MCIRDSVKLAYLIQALPANVRDQIHCAVDTHDVLHLRMKQFQESGHDHWLNITRDQEAQAIALFDTVIAIQPREAESFRQLCPETKVIVCGHSGEPFPQLKTTAHESKKLRIGYLASKNAANESGLKNLLQLSTRLGNEFQWVIGGSVCDNFEVHSRGIEGIALENINVIGHVDTLAEFYDQIDVAMNLVQFGTGLKIKNVEALSHGKPLLTTRHGLEGMMDVESDGIFASDTDEQIGEHLKRLAGDRDLLAELQTKAYQFATSEYSDVRAYNEFQCCINATSGPSH